MNYIPILFSTPMVQAILEGQKTQSRRVIKALSPEFMTLLINLESGVEIDRCKSELINTHKVHKGDILWVRETWALDYFGKGQYWHFKNGIEVSPEDFVYRATSDDLTVTLDKKWKPSIFMPKAACRLFLEVTDVRVERLQDISEADMIAEGIRVPVSEKGNAVLRLSGKNPPLHFLPDGALQDSYDGKLTQYDFLKAEWASLWSDINGRDSWDANPWVWAYTFKKINKPSNFI